MTQDTLPRKILIVDDSLISLEIFTHHLKKTNYKVHCASTGQEALRFAEEIEPDLILLDIMLPDINGYEVCRKIKENTNLSSVPVLFLSALDSVNDKVLGFEAGGVDYISKPCQREELLARVKTHLDLFCMRKENERYANKMELLARQRAISLVHAERLATLGTLSAGVAHEINNPTTFISIGVQTIDDMWQNVDQFIRQYLPDLSNDKKLSSYLEQMPREIENIKNGVKRIVRIVSTLKAYSRSGNTRHERCTIKKCIEAAIELCSNRLKRSVSVTCDYCQSEIVISADSQQVEQVFVNLLINATDAIETIGSGAISIQTTRDEKLAIITVEDTGPGIPTECMGHIFDPFFTTKGIDKGTGLGLSISKGIMDEHNGKITVENCDKGGAKFTLTFPLAGEH